MTLIRSLLAVACVCIMTVTMGALGHAVEKSNDELARIAEASMTPQPLPLQTSGDTTTRQAGTDASPESGLSICSRSDGTSVYTMTPQSSTQFEQTVESGDQTNVDGVQPNLIVVTSLEISRYESVNGAQRAWKQFLVKAQRECNGVIYAPNVLVESSGQSSARITLTEVSRLDPYPSERIDLPVNQEWWTNGTKESVGSANVDVNTQSTMQYASWRLAGSTIVRAGFALLWEPANTMPATDPQKPIITVPMKRAVNKMAKRAAAAIMND